MTHRKKITSQSGFMSVEAIATTLFYLIMVAVITLIASQIMNSGKMASTLNALSILRVNVQYVGVNAGSTYSSVVTLKPNDYVPLISATTGGSYTKYTLPSAYELKIGSAHTGDTNPDTGARLTTADSAFFTMEILKTSPIDCRKIAYYGIGAGYGVATGTPTTTAAIGDGGGTPITAANVESTCSPSPAAPVTLHLTSK